MDSHNKAGSDYEANKWSGWGRLNIWPRGGGPSRFREGRDSGVLVGHVSGFILLFHKLSSDFEPNK